MRYSYKIYELLNFVDSKELKNFYKRFQLLFIVIKNLKIFAKENIKKLNNIFTSLIL